MPIQNGKYINPGWTDNSPPAIDASELNAISDTLQNLDANGTGYTAGNGISIIGQQISAKLSSQSDNSAIFGSDGGIYVPTQGGGGKRYATFVIGTSTAGWTEADCDYLCDGTDDDIEFNEAISNFPQIGGEIVVLPGQYNISNTINMSGISSFPSGKIRGLGSWSKSVTLKWTGQYTSSEITGSVAGSETFCIMNVWNGEVSNILFDMNATSQASGNVGVKLGTLGISDQCYFYNCPTSVLCTPNAFFKNCYISSSSSNHYGVYCTGGFVEKNYFSISANEIAVYTETAAKTPTLIQGNVVSSFSSGTGGIICTGIGSSTLVANNILVNSTVIDQTETYHPTFANNVEA